MLKELTSIQSALDALALALPKGFKWPAPLRASYESACETLTQLSLGRDPESVKDSLGASSI